MHIMKVRVPERILRDVRMLNKIIDGNERPFFNGNKQSGGSTTALTAATTATVHEKIKTNIV